MHRNTPRTHTLNRTLAVVAVAIGLNATMLGALMEQPERGEPFVITHNPIVTPVMVSTITFSALKAGFEARFGHAARDLRHAERNVLRSIHHGARTIGVLVSWSGSPASAVPAC